MGHGNLNFFTGYPMNHLAALPVQRPSFAFAFALASIRSQAPLPGSGPLPHLPPLPPEVVPSPLDRPLPIAPEIREPDQPGVHVPITDNPPLPTPTRH